MTGLQLAAFRHYQGLTQKQFGEKIGVSAFVILAEEGKLTYQIRTSILTKIKIMYGLQ